MIGGKKGRICRKFFIDAIDAALKPAETNYYYYALGKDGKHHYSTTLQEHNDFLNSGNYGG